MTVTVNWDERKAEMEHEFKKRNVPQKQSWKQGRYDSSLSAWKQRSENSEVDKKRLNVHPDEEKKARMRVFADVMVIKEGYARLDLDTIFGCRGHLKRDVHTWRVCLRALHEDSPLARLPPRGSQFHCPLSRRAAHRAVRLAEKTLLFAKAVDACLAWYGLPTERALDDERVISLPTPLSGDKRFMEDREVAYERTKPYEERRQDAQRLHWALHFEIQNNYCEGDQFKRTVHNLRVHLRALDAPVSLPNRRVQYANTTRCVEEDKATWIADVKAWNLRHPFTRASYYRPYSTPCHIE